MTTTKTNDIEIKPNATGETCPGCGSDSFMVARDMVGTRRCVRCHQTWVPGQAVVEYKYKKDNYVEPHFAGQQTLEQRRKEAKKKLDQQWIDSIVRQHEETGTMIFHNPNDGDRFDYGWDAARADMLRNPPDSCAPHDVVLIPKEMAEDMLFVIGRAKILTENSVVKQKAEELMVFLEQASTALKVVDESRKKNG